MKDKKEPRRFLKFKSTDSDTIFEVKRIVKVSVEKKFFHMDELKDGNWRITYNGNMFDTLKDIESIEIIKE